MLLYKKGKRETKGSRICGRKGDKALLREHQPPRGTRKGGDAGCGERLR
jgi:hypothetical protein